MSQNFKSLFLTFFGNSQLVMNFRHYKFVTRFKR